MTDTIKKPQQVRVGVTALDEAIASAYCDGLRKAMAICQSFYEAATPEGASALRCAVAIKNEIERLTK